MLSLYFFIIDSVDTTAHTLIVISQSESIIMQCTGTEVFVLIIYYKHFDIVYKN